MPVLVASQHRRRRGAEPREPSAVDDAADEGGRRKRRRRGEAAEAEGEEVPVPASDTWDKIIYKTVDGRLEFELDPESEEYRSLCAALAAELCGTPIHAADDFFDEFDHAVEEDSFGPNSNIRIHARSEHSQR